MSTMQRTRRPVERVRRAHKPLQRHAVARYATLPKNLPRPPEFKKREEAPKHPPLRRDMDLSHLRSFPSLLHPHPYLDTALTYDEPPNWANPHPLKLKVHGLNRAFWPFDPQTGKFKTRTEAEQMLHKSRSDGAADSGSKALQGIISALPRSIGDNGEGVDALHRYTAVRRGITQQTGQGKINSYAVQLIVGNGNGLVGWGQGKHDHPNEARNSAFRSAIIGLDRVERFQNRTIWNEVSFKFGATTVVLRPRPIGFGIRTGPIMHQVCKAAGIKDISGKIYGSRNKMNVVKATCLALWSGGARPGMGDGVGGGGRRSEKGQGARSRDDVERARGRNLLEL